MQQAHTLSLAVLQIVSKPICVQSQFNSKAIYQACNPAVSTVSAVYTLHCVRSAMSDAPAFGQWQSRSRCNCKAATGQHPAWTINVTPQIIDDTEKPSAWAFLCCKSAPGLACAGKVWQSCSDIRDVIIGKVRGCLSGCCNCSPIGCNRQGQYEKTRE